MPGYCRTGSVQTISEVVLADSQCGFRPKGRGCVDVIFAARQLLEKAREHEESLFVVFVDLRKTYNSVPRNALWTVLLKYGVPPRMVSEIRSLHVGISVAVRVGDSTTNDITVTYGLRQGCTLAPTLFNLYFSADWRARCMHVLRHRHPRVRVRYEKLVGDRTAKSRLYLVRITESKFADDAAVYALLTRMFIHE